MRTPSGRCSRSRRSEPRPSLAAISPRPRWVRSSPLLIARPGRDVVTTHCSLRHFEPACACPSSPGCAARTHSCGALRISSAWAKAANDGTSRSTRRLWRCCRVAHRTPGRAGRPALCLTSPQPAQRRCRAAPRRQARRSRCGQVPVPGQQIGLDSQLAPQRRHGPPRSWS